MNTFTITEAKQILGALLKRAAAGEEIGIVSGKDIIALRKVAIAATDRGPALQTLAQFANEGPGGTERVSERPSVQRVPGEELLNGLALEGSGLGDGSVNHDAYIYDGARGRS